MGKQSSAIVLDPLPALPALPARGIYGSNIPSIMVQNGKTNHSPHFVETEINTPSESTFIADHKRTFIFSIGLSCAKLFAFECEQYAS